jgi:uncharacterized protein YgiM (DUF1202 family)
MRRFASLAMLLSLLTFLGWATVPVQSASAQLLFHRNGCHAWHTCPSDTGSYVCGDTGHGCNFDANWNRIAYPPSASKPYGTPKAPGKPAAAAVPTKAVVNTATINMRAAPSTSAAILGKYNRGTVLTLLSRSNGWVKVMASNGRIGWMSASLVVLR